MEFKQVPKGIKGAVYTGDLKGTHYMVVKCIGRTDGLHIVHKYYRAPINQWSTRYDKMRGYTFDSKLVYKGTREECIEAIKKELA